PFLGLMTADAVLAHLHSPAGSAGGRLLAGSLGVLFALLGAGVALGAYYAAFVAGGVSLLAWAGVLGGAGGLALAARGWLAGRNPAACLGALAVVGCLGLVYFGSFEEWKSLDRRVDRAATAPGRVAPPGGPAGGMP
ncbi:MAG: hypothetical protein HYU38_05590, partial [Candidatus Tectomicrobia bacterium]|nr:hypothetical protein [Candidatus Tectomicrobia bacterium]